MVEVWENGRMTYRPRGLKVAAGRFEKREVKDSV
jgi:hypothetical protein